MISTPSLLIVTLLLNAASSLAAPVRFTRAAAAEAEVPRAHVEPDPSTYVRIVDKPIHPRGPRSRTYRRSRLAIEKPEVLRRGLEIRDATPASLAVPPRELHPEPVRPRKYPRRIYHEYYERRAVEELNVMKKRCDLHPQVCGFPQPVVVNEPATTTCTESTSTTTDEGATPTPTATTTTEGGSDPTPTPAPEETPAAFTPDGGPSPTPTPEETTTAESATTTVAEGDPTPTPAPAEGEPTPTTTSEATPSPTERGGGDITSIPSPAPTCTLGNGTYTASITTTLQNGETTIFIVPVSTPVASLTTTLPDGETLTLSVSQPTPMATITTTLESGETTVMTVAVPEPTVIGFVTTTLASGETMTMDVPEPAALMTILSDAEKTMTDLEPFPTPTSTSSANDAACTLPALGDDEPPAPQRRRNVQAAPTRTRTPTPTPTLAGREAVGPTVTSRENYRPRGMGPMGLGGFLHRRWSGGSGKLPRSNTLRHPILDSRVLHARSPPLGSQFGDMA